MFSFLSKFTKDHTLSRLEGVVSFINEKEKTYSEKTDEELKTYSLELKKRAEAEDLEKLIPEAFALVRESAKRTLKQRHFDVQLMGGLVLHEGKIAEMRTGEGKTLVATLAAYTNALQGKGTHVITVNDYLAKRDAIWMGQIYHALGLSVSCIVHDNAFQYDPTFQSDTLDKERDETGSFKIVEDFLRPISRKEAYETDITYGTNHEFGFDYLRDNLVLDTRAKTQRGHHYAIIDEIDSILIDEARTPLIIAAPDQESSELYKVFAKVVERLEEETDYTVEEKTKSVNILESGIEKVEKMVSVTNLYDPENTRLVHILQESLKAKALFRKDKEYVVKDGEIIIVDEFTGRMLQGRRYSGGLHQAIEAKEGVHVQNENRTYAQITIQNYFRLYEKISGMTGTAQTSAEEFHKVYKLEVVSIPTNKVLQRKDLPDVIYKTKNAKYKAIAEEVKKRHALGQPVLLGTTSIANNEVLSHYLSKAGIPHEVLNAKNNEREGMIIAQAGQKGAVTVATNMAGRGVDIILGGNPPKKELADEVRSLGGLHVIGTERHEARRIDNQLRGRAGRQGDPGSSQFFLSLEDDLLRIFGGDKMKTMMERFNVPDDMPIDSPLISKVVNQAQGKVEGINFDMRKHLLDFDDVLNKQRTAVYAKREHFLKAGVEGNILPVLKEYLESCASKTKEKLFAQITELPTESEDRKKAESSIEDIDARLTTIPELIPQELSNIFGQQMTRIIDLLWVEHLEHLDSLRDTVNIRAYGQHEPIVEYRREAHMLFREMNDQFEIMLFDLAFQLFKIDITALQNQPKHEEKKPIESPKEVGRNDPCWCGSGKKFKKCHGT